MTLFTKGGFKTLLFLSCSMRCKASFIKLPTIHWMPIGDFIWSLLLIGAILSMPKFKDTFVDYKFHLTI